MRLYSVYVGHLAMPVCGKHVHQVLADLKSRSVPVIRVGHGTEPCRMCR